MPCPREKREAAEAEFIRLHDRVTNLTHDLLTAERPGKVHTSCHLDGERVAH